MSAQQPVKMTKHGRAHLELYVLAVSSLGLDSLGLFGWRDHRTNRESTKGRSDQNRTRLTRHLRPARYWQTVLQEGDAIHEKVCHDLEMPESCDVCQDMSIQDTDRDWLLTEALESLLVRVLVLAWVLKPTEYA